MITGLLLVAMRSALIWVVFMYGLITVMSVIAAISTGKELNGWDFRGKKYGKSVKNPGEINGNLTLARLQSTHLANPCKNSLHPQETGTRRIVYAKVELNIETANEKKSERIVKATSKQKMADQAQKLVDVDTSRQLIQQTNGASGDDISGSGDLNLEENQIFSRYEQLVYHQGDSIEFHQNNYKEIKAIDLAFQPPTARPNGMATQRTQAPTEAATQRTTQLPTLSPTQSAIQLVIQPPPAQAVKPTKPSPSPIIDLPHSTSTKGAAKAPHRQVRPVSPTWMPAAVSPAYPTPLQGCRSDIDLVILVEGTMSIGHTAFRNFLLLKNFLKDIVRRLVISSKDIRVGLITFGLRAYMHLGLYGGSKIENVMKAIDKATNFRNPTWRARTGAALDFTHKHFFGCYCSPRNIRKKMILVITDGRSIDDVFWPANRLKSAGIQIIAIGIGRYFDIHQLNCMVSCSSSRNVFTSSFSKTAHIVHPIVKRICEKSGGSLVDTMSCPCR